MRNEQRVIKFIKLAVVCVAFALFASLAACNREQNLRISQVTGGDIARGRHAIHAHGCATCHTIPGISGANGLVGPPLDRMASRTFLAGRIQNTPQNMTHWVRFPKQVDPETAMPQMEITEQEGRDITAYLYTLR